MAINMKRRPSPTRTQLQLEALEDRCLLSTTPPVPVPYPMPVQSGLSDPRVLDAMTKLSADVTKTLVHFKSAVADAELWTAAGATATGAGATVGIPALVAGAAKFTQPDMVRKIENLASDYKSGDVKAVLNDVVGLMGVAALSLGTDIQNLSNDMFTLIADVQGVRAAWIASILGLPFSTQAPIAIESFSVFPLSPAQGQSITATAHITDAPANTVVKLSVQGTDGYSDSVSKSMTGDDYISLDIPGAAPGVTDTITLTVPGLPQRQISVTYH